jgi:hypothetical protein
MSGARVVLAHENVAYAGVIAFDGEVLEILGFADTASHRMPIELIDEVEVSDREFNAFSNPAKGDSYGIQLAIDASDDEVAALHELADAVRSVSGGLGRSTG